LSRNLDEILSERIDSGDLLGTALTKRLTATKHFDDEDLKFLIDRELLIMEIMGTDTV
jgi:hypothetical protein